MVPKRDPVHVILSPQMKARLNGLLSTVRLSEERMIRDLAGLLRTENVQKALLCVARLLPTHRVRNASAKTMGCSSAAR